MNKTLLKNLVLVLVSVVFSLLAAEFTVRIFSVFYFPKMMELDDRLGWQHARNREKDFVNVHGQLIKVRQNNLGHRGRDQRTERTTDKRRVIVLGDSFTEAVQVSEDESFTKIIETADTGLEVWNAGVGGYGTVQEYLYLRSYGDRFNSDLILLMFYENDLTDNCISYSPGFGPRPYAILDKSGLQIHEELNYEAYSKFALQVPFWPSLNRHSYLYNFLNTRVYHKLKAEQMRQVSRASLRDVKEKCASEKIIHHLFNKISDLSQQIDTRFAIVLIPTAGAAERGVAPSHFGILESCKVLRLPCLSLVDAMHEGIIDGAKPYFMNDIHWTAEGHSIAAEEIALFIRGVLGIDDL